MQLGSHGWSLPLSPGQPQMTCLLVSAPNEAGSKAGRNQRSYFYKTGVFVHAVQRQSRTVWLELGHLKQLEKGGSSMEDPSAGCLPASHLQTHKSEEHRDISAQLVPNSLWIFPGRQIWEAESFRLIGGSCHCCCCF